MDVEVKAGVEGLKSFALLKLLGVNVVLRRFLWFGAGGWRFLIICVSTVSTSLLMVIVFILPKDGNEISRDGSKILIYNICEVIKTRKMIGSDIKKSRRWEAL